MDRSWDLLNQGQTHAARLSAQKALEIKRNAPDAHNLLGYIYALEGAFDAALEHYRTAMELDEWFLDPILNAAELLAHPDADPNEAIRLCRNAADNMELSAEETADAALIEIEALMSLNNEAEACSRVYEALSHPEPLSETYVTMFGRILYECGDILGATQLIQRLDDVTSPTADTWYLRGLLAREQGHRIDAVKAFSATRDADLLLPPVEWAPSPDEWLQSLRAAIQLLPAQQQDSLINAEVHVFPYPTQAMVQDEQDPRQILRLRHVLPEHNAFGEILFFTRNAERMLSPLHPEADLARYLAGELDPIETEH
ncbi:MAG: tetratricopeptide repeat protein [Proteobacteria bacterium]|jgi:Tfp pilus assembly protein PilF|nr:tetratricopeptide repeat protein [Pseudomonadota bacterium]NLN62855.1 tetratricopeptide repeat protein [Myxococcales bacterium]